MLEKKLLFDSIRSVSDYNILHSRLLLGRFISFKPWTLSEILYEIGEIKNSLNIKYELQRIKIFQREKSEKIGEYSLRPFCVGERHDSA